MYRIFILSLLITIFALPSFAKPRVKMPAKGQWLKSEFKSEEGSRMVKLYIPTTYSPDDEKKMPLMLMLHGCLQAADEFAAGSWMNEVAEKYGFLVLYPEQPREANPMGCWNWFEPSHQTREGGEPLLLAKLVRETVINFKLNPKQVYVVGFSAGGGMAAILASCFPDVFAAAALHSGLGFQFAKNQMEAFTAMSTGSQHSLKDTVSAALACSAGHARAVPMVIFHGSKDPFVNPRVADQITQQATKMHDLQDDNEDNESFSSTPFRTKRVESESYPFTIMSYGTPENAPIHKLMIEGLGHAWSGGNSAYQYNDSRGPKASLILWKFISKYSLPE